MNEKKTLKTDIRENTRNLLYELDSIKTDTPERLAGVGDGILTGLERVARLFCVLIPISIDSESIPERDDL